MVLKALNYQTLVKRFITVPFLLILTSSFLIYLFDNLLSTVRHEVKTTQQISQLIAKSSASGNATLSSIQIQDILLQTPYIESMTFFPFNPQQNLSQNNLTLKNILFDQYFGMSIPVSPDLLNNKVMTQKAPTNLITGYVITTVDLKKIRKQWFLQNLPMFIMVLIITFINLFIILKMVNKLTSRLLELEKLSQHVLQDDCTEADYEHLVKETTGVWIFERAFAYLLNKQKTQTYQIDQLSKENTAIKAENLKQIQQNSNFQNTLTHEFKLSINRIEAGLQLLQSQYISNEQKDAAEIISLGKDDLNAKLNQIIQMNRIDKGQTGIELYQFSPSKLIEEIVESFQALANEKHILLTEKTYHTNYILEGDVQKIRLIISSLIQNAIKFTIEGSVTIISQLQHLEKDIRWSIQIQDTGPGIAQQYQQQIFEPFFQINPEIKHTAMSNTVGLYLAKRLTELLNGEILVTSDINQGTTFHLSFVLKDWKNYFERTSLKDKCIVFWYKDEKSDTKTQRLQNAGAMIKEFKDQDLLLDYLYKNKTDAVIISNKISKEEVISFIQALREKETSHRVVTIYYYTPPALTLNDKELLKTFGVDYIENDTESNDIKDEYLKQISAFLT